MTTTQVNPIPKFGNIYVAAYIMSIDIKKAISENPTDLLKFIALKKRISYNDLMFSGSRKTEIVTARRTAIRILHQFTDFTLDKIGCMLLQGADHTTVLHHLKVARSVKKMAKGEQEFYSEVVTQYIEKIRKQ